MVCWGRDRDGTCLLSSSTLVCEEKQLFNILAFSVSLSVYSFLSVKIGNVC